MSLYNTLIIKPLNSMHQRKNFTCGVDSLDNYIKKQAKQDIKRLISKVFVATTETDPETVIGYYTLSALSIELSELPKELAHKLPKHAIPAALLGRLVCSSTAKGHGVGKMLLTDAIKRTLAISDEIAIYAMVVDAIDDSAMSFYEKYGFIRLTTKSKRLFLQLKKL